MIPLSVLRKLYLSLKEHRTVEANVHQMLKEVLEQRYIKPKSGKTRPLTYAQRNFFSILFLSIYRALGIAKERRLFYGVVNHCLRGIVTGTDNLLDDEYKELLPLNFPDEAVRFKSVMHILLFDRILFRIIEKAQAGLAARPDISGLHREIFAALVPIGAEEAQEEGGVGTILTPAEILSSVHMYKGGKLLCLAFVAPLWLEKEKAAQLGRADRGIYSIGLALQIIDDLTDFYADLRDKRHNYLVSSIYHEGSAGEKESLKFFLSGHGPSETPIETAYTDSVTRVMEQAIARALQGFDLLAAAGYWLDRRGAMSVIRYLFHLRGVKNLLPFIPKNDAFPEPMEIDHG